MSWLILMFAGVFEILWVAGLKCNAQMFRPSIFTATVVSLLLSLVFLSLSMKRIPLGTAYAIWTGIGTLGAFAFGILCFREPVSAGRLVSVLLLVVGLIGLKLTSTSTAAN
jgi:quaternary ammonium compound-resistance protein SugE